MSREIVPIILCGGNGTRLWPLSRASYPKQFTRPTGAESLFQAAAERVSGPGFAPPTIVTRAEFRFLALGQLTETEIAPGSMLLEPEGRDTGPAVLAAALSAAQSGLDRLLLVSPSDHVIGDVGAFQRAVRAGTEAARDGRIVTFGVPPSRPETAYGYLELESPDPACPQPDCPDSGDTGVQAPRGLTGFVEKPDARRAAEMLASGRHLWNSGLYLFSARTILTAFARSAPDLLPPVRRAVDRARPDPADPRLLHLAPEPWGTLPSVSLDYAVMEDAANLVAVPLDGTWSDLGSWDAMGRTMGQDATGTAIAGPVEAIDCAGSLLRAEQPDQMLVGIGLRNLVVVAMHDAVLVADRSAGEAMRETVVRLKAQGRPQACDFPRCHRPWGWYESLAAGERFQVKRIVVHPGKRLSLQSHVHRAEHWVVVAGSARVTLGKDIRTLAENESIYVSPGSVHRLENPGKLDLHLIEVQTGPYLGEDDIVRLEDDHARETVPML